MSVSPPILSPDSFYVARPSGRQTPSRSEESVFPPTPAMYLSGPAVPPRHVSPAGFAHHPAVHSHFIDPVIHSISPDPHRRKRSRREAQHGADSSLSPPLSRIQPCVQCAQAGKGDECGRNRRTIGCRRCNTYRLSCSFRAGMCTCHSWFHFRSFYIWSNARRPQG